MPFRFLKMEADKYQKKHLLVRKKGDLGWLNASLKITETREELSTTCILNKSYVKMPVST